MGRYAVSFVLSMAAATAGAGMSSTAAAAEHAAMVLSVAGEVTPAVDAFDTLPTGARLELGDEATVEFVHTASCTVVRVQGGTLVLAEDAWRLFRGKVLATKEGDCPKEVRLARDAAMAGVILRGPPPRFSMTPVIVLSGPGAGGTWTVSVSRKGELVLERAIEGTVFVWPHEVPPLKARTTYTLTLSEGDDRRVRYQSDFRTVAARSDRRTPELPFLISID